MSMQADDPSPPAPPAPGVVAPPPGPHEVDPRTRARARSVDIALAATALVLIAPRTDQIWWRLLGLLPSGLRSLAYTLENLQLGRLLLLAVVITLVVRTARRRPAPPLDLALQCVLLLVVPALWVGRVILAHLADGIVSIAWQAVSLAVLVVAIARRSQNAPYSTGGAASSGHEPAGLGGDVLEVTDLNGMRVQVPLPGQAPAGTNGFAVASLVLALVGLGGILAVIFGHLAHSQMRRTGERGWGMATAGLVLGYLGIAVGCVLIAGYVYVVSHLTF